jgi:RHS repeat-associated protein
LDSLYSPPSLGPGTWATRYHYNPDRQLTAIERPDGVTIGFGYEATTGRPSTVTFDRGQLSYSYSPTTGQLTSMSAPAGLGLAFGYNGALLTSMNWTGAVSGGVAATYNTDFRVATQTVNGGNNITFGYDRDGLLTSAGVLGLKRHAQHSLLDRDSVGTGTNYVLGTWGYDPKGALQSYAASHTGTGTPLFETSYVRDSLSRTTELTETLRDGAGTFTTVSAFTYDSAGRLETVRRNGTLAATYRYDLNGNRLDVTTPGGVVSGTYDAQDRLSQYGSTSYTYTANGELRTRTDAEGTTTYTYDALGNLTAVALPVGTQIEYLIDPLNRRIGKKVDGTLVRRWLWGSQLAPVAELDGAGALVSRFVYATRGNVPDYMVKAGQTYRLVLDHLGSVRLVVNSADGTVAQRIDYDEFGRVTQNTSPGFQPFGYAGGLLDDHTGLVRFGARDYDPATGRWTAKDPLSFRGGDANLYVYARNNPINYVDPAGLAPLSECVQRLLKEYFPDVNLESLNIERGVPDIPFLPRDTQGITAYNTIYLVPGQYDDLFSCNPSSGAVALVGHEVVHVQQYAAYGEDYARAYFYDAAWQLLNGRHPYRNNKFERPGFAKEAEVLRDLEARFPNGINCSNCQ